MHQHQKIKKSYHWGKANAKQYLSISIENQNHNKVGQAEGRDA